MIMMSPEVKDLDLFDDDPSYIPSYKASVTLDYQLPRLPPGTLLFPRDWMNTKKQASDRTRIYFIGYFQQPNDNVEDGDNEIHEDIGVCDCFAGDARRRRKHPSNKLASGGC